MAKIFKNNKSIESDIRETLLEILNAADRTFLKKIDAVQLERSLIDEAHFLIPCDESEMVQVENYVHRHIGELYQIVRRLS